MDTIGAFEAKTHLSRLLERVAGGEQITITRHGVAVAMLVPVPGHRKRDVKDVIQEVRALRHGKKLKGLSIRKMIDDGRRK